jgi:hypothetical protein
VLGAKWKSTNRLSSDNRWHDLCVAYNMHEDENDWYAILEVSPDASPEVIKAAVRTLSNLYHPDHAPDADKAAATQRMQLINGAKDVLLNPQARAAYDVRRDARANDDRRTEEDARARAKAQAHAGDTDFERGFEQGNRAVQKTKGWAAGAGSALLRPIATIAEKVVIRASQHIQLAAQQEHARKIALAERTSQLQEALARERASAAARPLKPGYMVLLSVIGAIFGYTAFREFPNSTRVEEATSFGVVGCLLGITISNMIRFRQTRQIAENLKNHAGIGTGLGGGSALMVIAAIGIAIYRGAPPVPPIFTPKVVSRVTPNSTDIVVSSTRQQTSAAKASIPRQPVNKSKSDIRSCLDLRTTEAISQCAGK